MPTITCSLNDLNSLAGLHLTPEEIDEKAGLFKGEFKGYQRDTDELKLELQDTNRPDLWCVEGIARQLRFKLGTRDKNYDWFSSDTVPVAGEVIVDPALESVRPFVGAIAIRDIDITEDILVASIQSQEKLTDNLGRHRSSVSIGIYDLNQITFPVHYKAVGLSEVSFIPLGNEEAMTPQEILEKHPKGIQYRHILEDREKVPMLVDATGDILSFPPIINSRSSGEVAVGRRDLFIEATGTNFYHMLLALNIFAVNMVDRGGKLEKVQITYPFETPVGSRVMMPHPFDLSGNVSLDEIENLLGHRFEVEHVQALLEEYGYQVSPESKGVHVVMPPWRHDFMHTVDVVEDIAISAGYEYFKPEMPTEYTVGKLDRRTLFSDRVRSVITSFGFEEVISNILCSQKEFKDFVGEPDRRIVEIGNPMSEKYSALRDRIIPSLLRVERDSSSAAYPHRIFESGEVTVHDDETESGIRTRNCLGVMVADRDAGISTVQSFLETLLYTFNLETSLKSVDSPIFIPGRSGEIYAADQRIGWIGEIHPQTLESFEIGMPCVGFEVDLDILVDLWSGTF